MLNAKVRTDRTSFFEEVAPNFGSARRTIQKTIMFDLTNKTALVSGAGSGIGAAIAETLARAGAFVYVADRDEDGGQNTVAAIRASGGEAEFMPLDVTREADCARAATAVCQRWERLDILVNNAGVGGVGNLPETSGEELDRMYAVNVRGVFNLSKAFIEGMIARKSGNIINIASVGGIVGIRDRVAYCATKFAVVGLTKSMALDHAPDGVRVNCICPARVETPFVQQRISEYADPAQARREMTATQPVGRMGTPAEIAAAALYLAADESAFVTGSAFVIDGAYSAG